MKRYLTFANLRLAAELLLVLAVLVAVLAHSVPSQAASLQASAPNLTLYWYQCNGPNNHIGLFMERVHIFCDTTSPIAGAPALSASITWFTIPTSPDSAAASRFMSLLQTSVITGKTIWLQLDPNDTSGGSFGCGGANCRRIYGMEMR